MTTGQKVIIGILIIIIIGLVIFGVLKATAPELVKTTAGTGTGGTGTGTGGTGTGGTGTGPGGGGQIPVLITDSDINTLVDKFNYEFKVSWTGSSRCTVTGELYSLIDADLIRFRNKYLIKYGESPQSILENSWSVCTFSNIDSLLIDRFKAIQGQ